MHIDFDPSGREARLLHLDAATLKNLLEQAEDDDATPEQNLNQRIDAAAGFAVREIETAKQQSYWWGTERKRENAVRATVNATTQQLLDVTQTGLERHTDENVAKVFAIGRGSKGALIAAGAKERLLRQSAAWYEKRKDAMQQHLIRLQTVARECGLPIDQKLLTNVQTNVEAMDARIADLLTRAENATQRRDALESVPQYQEIRRQHTELRQMLLQKDPSLAENGMNSRLEQMIRDALLNGTKLYEYVEKQKEDGAINDVQYKALHVLVRDVRGGNWWGSKDRRTLGAEVYSTLVLEEQDRNPEGLDKRIALLSRCMPGQNVQLNLPMGQMTFVLVEKSAHHLTLRCVDPAKTPKLVTVGLTPDPSDKQWHAAYKNGSSVVDAKLKAPKIGPADDGSIVHLAA